MHHLSPRTEAALNRLTEFAYGDEALVNEALSRYYNGEIKDLVGYVRDRRKEPRRLDYQESATLRTSPKT